MRALFLGLACLTLVPATPAVSQAGIAVKYSDLQTRFDRLQSVARSGVPAIVIETTGGTSSLFDQRGDGIVRMPETVLNAASHKDVTDALMLVALSQAVNNPAKPLRLSSTARTLAGVAAFVGNSVAEARVLKIGRNASYETTGTYRPENRADAPPSVNPVIRAMMWAKASGGCEARIVSGLTELGKGTDVLASDARKIMKALSASAWSPDTRCL